MNSIPKRSARSARVVGILGSAAADPYSLAIVQAAATKLGERGFHALFLSGGFPSAPFFSTDSGDKAAPSLLDGLILLAATLRGLDEDMRTMVARSTVPMVSIGAPIYGADVLTTDDETGVFQAVAHLVKRHECKRIAFISGPEGSVDGAKRLEAYRIALETFGLPRDPTLVARGDYEARSGREAVIELRRAGSHTFDAIVAANDLMAIGAIEGLRAAGLHVPDAVKVVGFDDMEEARFMQPSLTTVRQPMTEHGICAADVVIRRIEDDTIGTKTTQISTPLMIRQSCGCGQSDSVRRISLSPAAVGDIDERELIEDALRGVVRRQLAMQRVRRELARVADDMISAPGYVELARAATEAFRLVNPRRFVLCVYGGNQRHARVLLESQGRDVVFRSESLAFPVAQVLPPNFLKPGARPYAIAIEPLQLASEQLGYCILESETITHPHLELRHYLSAALGRITLTRELRRLYAAERKRTGTASAPPPASSRSTSVRIPRPGPSGSGIPKP